MRGHRRKREDQPLEEEVHRVLQTFPSRSEGLAKHSWGSVQPLLLHALSQHQHTGASILRAPEFLAQDPWGTLRPAGMPCQPVPRLQPYHCCETPCSGPLSCAHLRRSRRAESLAASVLGEAGQKGPTSLSLFSRDLNPPQEIVRLDQTPAEEDGYVRPTHCSTHTQNAGQPSSQPFTWP